MSVLLTTTENIPGREITSIIGIITATKVKGAGVIADWKARLSDFWGRKSESYSSEIEKLKQEAIEEVKNIAEKSSVDAVVGLKIDVEFINTEKGGLFMVTAIGTAVKTNKIQ